jgi:quinol monooxygenase YgiN
MPKVAVLAKMTAKDGQGHALVDALSGMIKAVGDEGGTEIYALHTDAASSDVVWFYELYTDKDALGAHSGSDAMKALGPSLGPLLAGRPEITLLNPVTAKGLTFG